MGSAAVASGLQIALDELRRAGVRVSPSSRQERALRALMRYNRREAPVPANDERAMALLREQHRTAWETFLIGYGTYLCRRRRYSPFTREKLQELIGGSELPDPRKTISRDTQFELYVATMLALGGLEVRPGEPDLVFGYGVENVGIAVKRIVGASARTIAGRVESAVTQIRGSGRRGFVAVQLDRPLAPLRARGPRSRLLQEYARAFDDVTDALRPFAGDNEVLGAMVYGYAAEWQMPGRSKRLPQLRSAMPFRWMGLADDGAQKMFFDDFTRRWQGGAHAHLDFLLKWGRSPA